MPKLEIKWKGFEDWIEESPFENDLRGDYPYLATDCDELALFFVFSPQKAICIASAKVGAIRTGELVNIERMELIQFDTELHIKQKAL